MASEGYHEPIEELSTETLGEQAAEISLPFDLSIKRVAIANFNLSHSSADVTVHKFQLSAKAKDSLVTLKSLNIQQIDVLLKQSEESHAVDKLAEFIQLRLK